MSHLKNKVARRTARLTSVLIAVLMILTVAPIIAFPASAETTTLYRIVHLECGRKYFSVANIKTLIDTMAKYGYNQLQLAFGNGGCRFLLNDMKLTFKDSSNTDVTLTSDTVKANITDGNKEFNGDTRYLSQTDMDEIITYANDKGIEIVPMLNMPGHATAIVYNTSYSDYSDNGKPNGNLNVANEAARNYGYALLAKYVAYFSGKGCKFFHFGSDESGYTGDNMTNFLTGCADVITNAGMTPRAFNDATSGAVMPTDVQITYWHKEPYNDSSAKSASALAKAGYKMINTHGRWYYVIKEAQNSEIGTKYWQGTVRTNATSVELPTLKAEKMDNKWVGINEYFDGDPGYGSTISGSLGSMFCIWCDASQDSYLTDSDVISENVNYGALYQIEKLAEHYWPNDIKTKPQITLDNDSGVPASVVNGTKFTLKADRSVTWSVEPETGVILISSNSVFGTSVSLEAVGVGTATVTATDENKLTASYTIEVTADTTEATTKNVELKVGESKTFDVASGIAAGDKTTGNEYIATANVATQTTEPETSYVLVNKLAAGEYYVSDKATDTSPSTKLTLESASNGQYYLKNESGDYIYPHATYAWWSQTWSYSIRTGTQNAVNITYNNDGSITVSRKVSSDWSNTISYLTFSNNAFGANSSSAKIYLYTQNTTSGESKGVLTITGTGEGDTSVTVGNATYNIKVTAPTFTESKALTYGTSFSLPSGAEAQITSGENCVTPTENNTKITAGQTDGNATVEAVVKNAGGKVTARYTYNITVSSIDFDAIAPLPVQLWITNTYVNETPDSSALQTENIKAVDAYGEDGVLLKTLVPNTGYKYESQVGVLYWRGVMLPADATNLVPRGNDYSEKGTPFTKLRYWEDSWQCYDGANWINITRQVFAYYVQINNVSNEITVATKDYGDPPKADLGNSGNGFALLSFAVVYPDGTLSRTEEEIFRNAMMFGFYNGTTRTSGLVFAENNSTYRVSKITATKGTNVHSGYGTTDWAPGASAEYGTKWGVNWNKVTNSAGDMWYDETEIGWTSSEDGQSITVADDAVTFEASSNERAALILIYLEVVETDNTLNIVYWDDNANRQITTNPMPIPVVVKPNVTFLNIVQNSAVVAGTFTLDDNAYIVNSSGGKQSFNKNLSTVPGVTGVYLSGMYKYVSASISTDGMTLTLHYNLKSAERDKNYVIDFGLPLVIKSTDFNIENTSSIEWVSLESKGGTLTRPGTYGTATIASDWSSVTYVLNSILTSKATIPLYVKFKNDNTVYLYQAHIYPASTMYYEENFVTPTNAGATDNGAWTLDGTRKSAEQTLSELGSRDRYGFDSAYENGLTYSMGSAWKTTVNGTTYSKNNGWPTITFTFKGTGFDIISLTDNTSGTIIVEVKNSAGYAVKTMLVNNYYSQADGLYQIPVIKAENLSYDEYTVTIIVAYSKLFDTNNRGSYTFCLDAVRVYNTLGTGSDVDAVYANDGEAAPTFTEIRDITSAADFDVNAQGVFVDGDPNAKYDTYQRLGPNHEIYLARGQAIAFNVSLEDGQHLFIGAKSPNGGAVMNINDGAKTVAINTATDMYYEITPKDGRVIILNTGDNILSLTTIKITSDPATTTQNSVEFSVDENLLVYARATAYAIMHPFAPEHFEANWTTVKLFRKSIHTLTVRTSTDVDYITVDGEKVTTFYYSVALEGWGWNRKFVKYKVFTVSLDDDAELGDYEVIAYNADGEASEPHIATLTGKVGVGKFN